jgi:hypothetical protein
MLRSSDRKCQESRRKLDGSKSCALIPSTTVPLTVQVLKPTMPLHDLPWWLRRRRKPSEELNLGEVYFWKQALGVSHLTLV